MALSGLGGEPVGREVARVRARRLQAASPRREGFVEVQSDTAYIKLTRKPEVFIWRR